MTQVTTSAFKPHGKFRSVVHIAFIVDYGNIVFDGAFGHAKKRCNLAVRKSVRQKSCDLFSRFP